MAQAERDDEPLFIVKTDEVAAGKGVFVTHSWEDAVDDIRAKLNMGAVRVELAKGDMTEIAVSQPERDER